MTRRRAAGDAAGDAYDDSPDDQLGLFAATAMVPPVVAGRESPAPFADWSAVAAAIRATRERRRKVQTLAGYLGMLDERGAMQAVRWFSGAASPAADARPLRIGRSVLWPALADIAGITRERLGERRVALGSTAAVAAELLAGRPGAGLSLGDVAWSIDQLAHTTSAASRAARVRALLGAADGGDAEWLVALLGGGLRIGLLGAQVEAAIALATRTPLDAVRQ
ncbi:MAG: hypothetical protein MUF53_12385, partial [Gemmatimonadaceae bacterium]|nr:hypothetical protein [Gemmatimonadaceae bacterium]